MATAFTRQLGAQVGVQLDPIRDRTDAFSLGQFDQTCALVGKFERGRIDKPFRVNRGTLQQRLGKPKSIALSLLNEARVHAYEALNRGARELVVYRLNVPAAVTSWVTVTAAATTTFAVVATISGTTHTLAVKHLGCHNDGIRVRIQADALSVAGTPAPNPVVTLFIYDADNIELFRIKGSLDATSVDEFGNSNYLPDVAAALTDELEFDIPTGKSVPVAADCYGRDAGGRDKFALSGVLVAFSEGGTAYGTTDYDRAMTALRETPLEYGYILGGGTRAVALITRMADLAYDTNRQFLFDVPGDLAPTAAIAFVAQLGFGTVGRDHYPQAYWAPLRATDPINGNKIIFGTSAIQAGLRCARNAIRNSYGLAEKNRPIGMVNGNIGRQNVTQVYNPSEFELSDLALGRINPVIFQKFSGGTFPTFADSITCAASQLSYRRLSTVAEMSAHLDEAVARFSRECLLLPQQETIQRMESFLERLFANALGSRWLVESEDPQVVPYSYTVTRQPGQEGDAILALYALLYDGFTRQVTIRQTITRGSTVREEL